MSKPPKAGRPNVQKSSRAAAKRNADYYAAQKDAWADLLAQPFTPAPKDSR